jgi:hypothetical protein
MSLGQLLFLGFCLWAVLAYALWEAADDSAGHAAGTSIQLLLLGGVTFGLVLYAIRALREHVNPFALLLTAASLGAIVWFTALYSQEVYPELPDQFGGGHPKQVRLLFSKDGAVGAQQIGVPLQPGSNLSRPLKLILDGDDFYTVVLPNRQTAQIGKDTVVGLQEDTKAPFAKEVEARNRGKHVGFPDKDDLLILTYSEKMDSASLIPDWKGDGRVPATIIVRPGPEGDELRFFNNTGQEPLPALGEIELQSGRFSAFFGPDPFRVNITRHQAVVVAKLRHSGDQAQAVPLSNALVWHPSPKAKDTKGNRTLKGVAVESDPSDPDPDF